MTAKTSITDHITRATHETERLTTLAASKHAPKAKLVFIHTTDATGLTRIIPDFTALTEKHPDEILVFIGPHPHKTYNSFFRSYQRKNKTNSMRKSYRGRIVGDATLLMLPSTNQRLCKAFDALVCELHTALDAPSAPKGR